MKIFLSGLKICRWIHNKKLKIENLNQKTIICAFILYMWRKWVFSQILCCWKLTSLYVRIKSPWLITSSKYKAILDRCFCNCAGNLHSQPGALTPEDNQTPEQPTLRRGLSLVSMMKSYLQSSQQRVSELLIHWCRQAWWTKRRVPVQRHGVMRGLSSSPSQWQILTARTARESQPTCQPAVQRHWLIYTAFSSSGLTFKRCQVYDLSDEGPGTYSLFLSAIYQLLITLLLFLFEFATWSEVEAIEITAFPFYAWQNL